MDNNYEDERINRVFTMFFYCSLIAFIIGAIFGCIVMYYILK